VYKRQLAQEEGAGPYSEGSKAKLWNVFGAEKALFSGKVVDILCALTGDCPDDCGGGERTMGITRADDGKLILGMKNSQASFNGANTDLARYCGKDVEVDGLFVGDPEITPTQVKYYQVQRIREKGGKWAKANKWVSDWKKRNPDQAKGKGPWFRRDVGVNKRIEANGHLGLGLEKDEAFKKYLFEE